MRDEARASVERWRPIGVLDDETVAMLRAELESAELEAAELEDAELPPGAAAALTFLLSMEEAGRDELVDMASSVTETVLECRRPLEVESSLSALLGSMITATVGHDVPIDPFQAQLISLTVAIELTAAAGGAPALAVLRALQAIGPNNARQRAAARAARLAATGVPEPQWAAIGRPRFVRAWYYADVQGAQATVGLTFDYAGREHALVVLIDHDLGGGVKDVFLVEGRAASRVYEETRELLADDAETMFADIDVTTAADVLADALREPPCPEDEGQWDTFASHDALLRSRVVLLAELAGRPVPLELLDGPPEAEDLDDLDDDLDDDDPYDEDGALAEDAVLRLKVELAGTQPPVWRRLEVPAELPLVALHGVLQSVFAWDGEHRHAFAYDAPPGEAGHGGREGRIEIPASIEFRLPVAAVLPEPGDVMQYTYGVGDGWEHLIALEEFLDPADGVAYPRCTGGGRAAPPRDCGGPSGYQKLVAALADPAHPDHAALRASAPEAFDPAAFRAADADARLAGMRQPEAGSG